MKMAKKSIYEKVRRESGRPRNFDFSLRELTPFTDNYGDIQIMAKYEIRIGGVSDEYTTITSESMCEPENGRHINYFNNDWDLQNDVDNAVSEHLWDFVGEYMDLNNEKTAYKQLIQDVGAKVKISRLKTKRYKVDRNALIRI